MEIGATISVTKRRYPPLLKLLRGYVDPAVAIGGPKLSARRLSFQVPIRRRNASGGGGGAHSEF